MHVAHSNKRNFNKFNYKLLNEQFQVVKDVQFIFSCAKLLKD